MLNNANLLSNTIWAILETILILGAGIKFFFKLNKRLDRIEYQLYENGGGSMKDQMNEVVSEVRGVKSDVTELKINQAVIKAKMEID
jgi:hypothetical protein